MRREDNRIRVYIYYDIIEDPWGGGNSFLRALRKYIRERRQDEFEIIDEIDGDYDVFFMNGGHKDQGLYIDLGEVRRWGRKGLYKWLSFGRRKIVYRLDGMRYRYNCTKSEMDELQFRAANIADHIIFQSRECLDSLREYGYERENHSIVHNGVDQTIFNADGKKPWDGKRKLRLFACNWSSNKHKGYEVISRFSQRKDTEVSFAGNWSEEVDKKRVWVIPPVKHRELAEHYRRCDVFLHAAEKDPCPNVVLEAMSCGLPVIYHDSGGTSEIAAGYGVPLPEVIDEHSIGDTLKAVVDNYGELAAKLTRDKDAFSIEKAGNRYLNVIKKVWTNEA